MNQATTSQPSADLLRAMAEEPAPESRDKLDQLRHECRRLRDDDAELTDLESRVEQVRSRRTQRLRETIPDMMDQAGVPGIKLAPEGNLPGVEIELRPHYSANIAAGWPDDKRAAGLGYLDANGAGDLIKTAVTVLFPREKRDDALSVVTWLKERGLDVDVKESVPAQTLTKWLKDTHKAGLPLPPLELIGGFVGRIAVIKEAKEQR